MKSNKGKGLLGLLGLLVVLGIFGFFGYDTLQKSKLVTDENGVTSQNGGIKLGLDLAGGVSITYQAKEENPSAEDMSDTQYKLQQRVQNYSSEAEVYQEGGNRINVDIPGVTDANKILEELGKPGSLQFYDENWNVVLEGTDVASAKAVIYKDHVDRFIEIGPGKTLAGFIRKINREATVINIEKFEDLEKLN